MTAGDVYAFGDYEYKYNYIWGVVDWLEYTSIDDCVEGWGVRVVDRTKSEYGTVITKINEKNITNMVYTFDNCKELLIAPAIPSGVTTIYSAFTYCTKLTTMPDMNKASNLINMEETFYDCVALKNVTKIPNSVTNMDYTFIGCTALETVPAIPNSVEKMNYTFTKCAALTGEIEINANPTSYYNCFNGTGKNIKITGSSTAETKAALASTSSGNVTY